ncbi:MAG: response regulator transcription factor [Dehalococcoidales bacterium]|nr:response regulator transcription factor [Dehalococcoidales bacterium]
MSRPVGARVLIVDDEPAILRAVRTILARHGFQVETAGTGGQALDRVAYGHPDLILLDLGLPDMDGLDVLREVRGRGDVPVVILSVRGAEGEKVKAFDLGADDYLTKPFGMEELVARVRVALRHSVKGGRGTGAIFRTGNLTVDLERRYVTLGGNEVHLTPTEYELLKAFISHPNKLLTDRMLLQQVWGPEYGEESHYLHVYVARLRKKIEVDPQNPCYLITEPGVGYRLLVDEI